MSVGVASEPRWKKSSDEADPPHSMRTGTVSSDAFITSTPTWR